MSSEGHLLGHLGRSAPNGDGRGRDGLPAARIAVGNVIVAFPGTVGAGLAPGMGDLNARHGAGRLDGLHDRSNACPRSSFQMPVQPGVMRPCGATAVASTTTSPAPPRASPARCTACQSVTRPSMAEYWHIGGTAMRLRRVTSLRVKGWNKADTVASCGVWGGGWVRTTPRGAMPAGTSRERAEGGQSVACLCGIESVGTVDLSEDYDVRNGPRVFSGRIESCSCGP